MILGKFTIRLSNHELSLLSILLQASFIFKSIIKVFAKNPMYKKDNFGIFKAIYVGIFKKKNGSDKKRVSEPF